MILNEQLDQLAKIWLVSGNNPELRSNIEHELIDLSETNQRFSREFFYAYFTVPDRNVMLHFIPGTIAYIDYGSHILVHPCFTEEVAIQLQENISNKVDTYGLVMADDVNSELSIGMRHRLRVTGFDTTHVMEISRL